MKPYLLLFNILIFASSLTAQDFTSSTYPMVSTTEALYSTVGGDTLIFSGKDSASTNLLPLGFHFQFCGEVFDSFSVNVDGFLRLGRLAIPDSLNNLSSGKK